MISCPPDDDAKVYPQILLITIKDKKGVNEFIAEEFSPHINYFWLFTFTQDCPLFVNQQDR